MMRRCSVRHHGFTLIEIIAVVLIVALLAGLAGASLHGAYHRASFDEVTQRVISYDAVARDFARRFGVPLQLTIGERGMSQGWLGQSPEARADRSALRLPEPYAVTALNEAQRVTISTDGRSRTYALRLTGPAGRQRWIVFAGLTGRASLFDDESQVDHIMDALAAPRLPAWTAAQRGADAD